MKKEEENERFNPNSGCNWTDPLSSYHLIAVVIYPKGIEIEEYASNDKKEMLSFFDLLIKQGVESLELTGPNLAKTYYKERKRNGRTPRRLATPRPPSPRPPLHIPGGQQPPAAAEQQGVEDEEIL